MIHLTSEELCEVHVVIQGGRGGGGQCLMTAMLLPQLQVTGGGWELIRTDDA
jgi:hypothetical protein